jgi:hypothetical protein
VTLRVEASERLLAAADDWADARMTERDEALRVKAEQALLEVEHLVAGGTAVDLDIDDGVISYDPSSDAEAFLAEQAANAGIDEETVVELYIELFADVFSEDDVKRPPNAPPTE